MGGGDNEPDITKVPAPAGWTKSWLVFLVDTTLDAPKVFYPALATGAVWERGHLDANDAFVVDETITQSTSAAVTIDFSAIADRWVIYRVSVPFGDYQTAFTRQLGNFPAIKIYGYAEYRAFAPPTGFVSFLASPFIEEITMSNKDAGVSYWLADARASKHPSKLDYSAMIPPTSAITLNLFSQFSRLKELKLPQGLIVSSLDSCAAYCYSLETLDLSQCVITSVSNTSNLCTNCYNLRTLNLSGCDLSNVTAAWAAPNFSFCYMLTNLILDGTTWANVSTSFGNSPNLTHESLLALIASLPTLSGTTLTLSLHPTAKERLTQEEIAVAEEKGWTVA